MSTLSLISAGFASNDPAVQFTSTTFLCTRTNTVSGSRHTSTNAPSAFSDATSKSAATGGKG
eukprot:3937058-Rhodomonas_salina.4